MIQPIRYFGGKHYQTKHLLALMQGQQHTHYCEPFAGGLSVLLAKPCEGIAEACNDLDGQLSNFWAVLADPQLFDQFYRRVEALPLSQPLFDAAAEQSDPDPVQRAVRFFIRARQSRMGQRRDYVTPTVRVRRGMSEQVSAWLSAVAGLPEVAKRLQRVEVRCMPAVDFIRRYDHPSCLHYCDPPYVHNTRQDRAAYACEMTDQDHVELLEVLARTKGKVLLSGYPNDLYSGWADRHGWRCVQFQIDNKASSVKQKQIKTECVWMNY